jgi:hypothetical protein
MEYNIKSHALYLRHFLNFQYCYPGFSYICSSFVFSSILFCTFRDSTYISIGTMNNIILLQIVKQEIMIIL